MPKFADVKYYQTVNGKAHIYNSGSQTLVASCPFLETVKHQRPPG